MTVGDFRLNKKENKIVEGEILSVLGKFKQLGSIATQLRWWASQACNINSHLRQRVTTIQESSEM